MSAIDQQVVGDTGKLVQVEAQGLRRTDVLEHEGGHYQ